MSNPKTSKNTTRCHFFAGIAGWAYALEPGRSYLTRSTDLDRIMSLSAAFERRTAKSPCRSEDTCGPLFNTSSPSASLQRSLASRWKRAKIPGVARPCTH